MVFIWYFNGIYMVFTSEEKRCQERFSTRRKIWRFMEKNYLSRKYLELSDVLCIFASDGILLHYTKYPKHTITIYEQVSTHYIPRLVFILCN